MRKYKILLVLPFFTLSIFSQGSIEKIEQIFPPSPEASKIIKQVEVPVDLYTGVPRIGFELLQLEGKTLNIPVGISYHASGIKVKDVSGVLGLGWSLDAVGAITRVVRSKPDEVNNGYIGINGIGKKISDNEIVDLSDLDIARFGSNYYDSEPDIYYFNFLSYSGKFTFNSSGEIVFYKENDFKIIPAIGPKKKNNYWTIITKDGTNYKFGISNSSKEKSLVKIKHGNLPEANEPEFVSTWYLESIESKNGEIVSYEYNKGNYTEDSFKVESFESLDCATDYVTTITTIRILNPSYLTKISNNKGSVNLKYSNSREDYLNAKKLIEITKTSLFDVNRLYKLKFNQSYFDNPDCTTSNSLCKRLRLDQIVEIDKGDNEEITQLFEYNENNLPSRNSPQIDHWGYYNRNNQENLISRINPISSLSSLREPNLLGTKSNILEKIQHKGGGLTEIEYEMNSFYNGSVNKQTGGLRVKSIKKEASDVNPIITNYRYETLDTNNSSGKEYSKPTYSTYKRLFYRRYTNAPYYCNSEEILCEGTVIRSSSLNELFDLNGTNIGYTEVMKLNSDGSKELNKFTDIDLNPDIIDTSDYFQYLVQSNNSNPANKTGAITDYQDPFGSPFAPPSVSNSHQRGLLLEKTVFNATNKIVYVSKNDYARISYSREKTSKGVKFNSLVNATRQSCDQNSGQLYTYGLYNVYNIGQYYIRSNSYQVSKNTEEYYDTNGVLMYTKENDFQYHDVYPTFLANKSLKDVANSTIKSYYKYPFDFKYGTISIDFDILSGTSSEYDSRNIYAKMVGENILSPTIETITVRDNEVIGGSISQYDEFEITNSFDEQFNSYLVHKEYSLEDKLYFNDYNFSSPGSSGISIQENYSEEIEFSQYSSIGNPQHIVSKGKNKYCIVWGYNHMYPIAKIENATYDQVRPYITNIQLKSNQDNDRTIEYNGQEGALRSELELLRTELPNAMITTYTYDPLIGITSVKDPRGNTKYYEYDDLNRLYKTKDANNKVITKTKYNFKNN